jgi:hypothetical protein
MARRLTQLRFFSVPILMFASVVGGVALATEIASGQAPATAAFVLVGDPR